MTTFAARFADATRTDRAGLAVRFGALAAGGCARTTGFFVAVVAAALASFFSFLPIFEFGAMPSPSAARGSPGMFLRLCTSTRFASLKVTSTLLSETISDTKPLPNFGWVTIAFSW